MKYMLLLLVAMIGGPILFFTLFALWARRYSRKVVQAVVDSFYEDNEGRILFVGTRRHGWGDFLQNNVVPRLPAGVRAVWFDRRGREEIDPITAVLRQFRSNDRKPLLIRIVRPEPIILSLHEELLPLKEHSAKNDAITEEVRVVIDGAMRRIRTISTEREVN